MQTELLLRARLERVKPCQSCIRCKSSSNEHVCEEKSDTSTGYVQSGMEPDKEGDHKRGPTDGGDLGKKDAVELMTHIPSTLADGARREIAELRVIHHDLNKLVFVDLSVLI